jgi:hypothetical protein
MSDLLKITGFLYVIFSAFLAVVFFSKADTNFLILISVPLLLMGHSLIILLVCFALGKILDNINDKNFTNV